MSTSAGAVLALLRSDRPRLQLDLAAVRAILGPYWSAIVQSFIATRAYGDGLEAAFRLLEAVERFRDPLGVRAYRGHRIALYLFLLTMLDKADRWEAYLAAWDSIRIHADLWLPYSADALAVHGPRLASFVRRAKGACGVSLAAQHPATARPRAHPSVIRVHFLYVQLHRKELIERKLARQRAGDKMGNLRHATRGTLTAEEIRQRLERIREWARAAPERQYGGGDGT